MLLDKNTLVCPRVPKSPEQLSGVWCLQGIFSDIFMIISLSASTCSHDMGEMRKCIDSCFLGGSHIGPEREGGDLPDKEVDERAGRLEDHAGGRQPQPQDQRHHPRASDGSNQVEAKLSTRYFIWTWGCFSAKYKKL